MKSGGFFKKFGVCALSAALCVSAFSACGETDGKGDKIDGNTDIAAVKSEQVKDEAAWKAAFDVSKFTNFSMKEEDKSTQAGVTQEGRLVYKFVGDKAYYSTYQKKSTDENEQHDIFFAKTNEVWAAYGINYKNGAKISESAYDMENHSEYEYIVSGEMGIAPVSQLAQTVTFDKVTYDETAKGYLYEVEGQGTATIKIAGGLFAGYIMKTESGEGDKKVVTEVKASYYDIGSTSISLPEKMGKPAEDKKDEDKKDDEKKDDDKKPGVVLTADTDFEALKSEKVDEAGWIKAFNYASYKNFTSYTAYRTTNSYAVQKATEAGGFLKIGSYELYCYIGADGAYKMSDGKTERTCASVFIRNDIPITMNYSCMCPDFSNNFWNFSYNESSGVYEYEGGLKTNAYFAEGNYSTYSSVRLKIVNGLLAYIDVENDGEPDHRKTTKFYDFGTTVVELPEIDDKKPGVVLTADTNFEALESEKVDAAGWAKAFNPASYNNFTALAYYDSIKIYLVQKSTGTSGFFGEKDTHDEDMYLYTSADGKYMGMSGGQVAEWPEGIYMRDGMPVLLNYSCMCPNFAKFFADFTYDETKKSYVYAGKGIRTNDYFLTGGDYADYVKVELKIVNGLVAYVSVEDSSGNKENTKFYDFGTTAITLPAIGK